jgi:hypothetical protein
MHLFGGIVLRLVLRCRVSAVNSLHRMNRVSLPHILLSFPHRVQSSSISSHVSQRSPHHASVCRYACGFGRGTGLQMADVIWRDALLIGGRPVSYELVWSVLRILTFCPAAMHAGHRCSKPSKLKCTPAYQASMLCFACSFVQAACRTSGVEVMYTVIQSLTRDGRDRYARTLLSTDEIQRWFVRSTQPGLMLPQAY